MQQIILVGGGGHCKSCIDVIEAEGKYQIAGIVDMPEMVGNKIMGYPVIGTDDDLPQLAQKYKNYLITVGQIKSAAIRIRIFEKLKKLNVTLPVIISPNAYISKYAKIGAGSIIMHHAIVNADASIGVNCIINTKALIEHEAFINSHTHISTAAIVNGQCEVGKECFIGSNTVLANNIEIADNTIVAAGSVMLASAFKPGNTYVGQRAKRFKKKKTMNKTFIIAEAGVNHNGSIEMAKKMIDAAANSGVDAVKFQSFKTENLVSINAPKAEYQKQTTGATENQFSMIKKLELDIESHKELMNYCKKRNINFMSSPFDLDSIDLLNELGLEIFKIPSGEITNLPYLQKIGKLNKKVILSTGMADLGEIEDAIDVLTDTGTAKEKITVLHCNTEYPTPMEDVNLTAMQTIEVAFDVEVGYSDHTNGIEVPIAAVTLGATVIEKHFTLDKNMEGPDHRASLEPHELKAMVAAIRNIEKALGSGIKKPSRSELKNKTIARKSIVALQDIKQGETFTKANIGIKRPGNGISPMRWNEIIGKVAQKDYKKDDLIIL